VSEFKTVDSNYFLFSFLICYFILFYFNFWGLRVRVNVTSLSHISHMSHVTWKSIEDSGRMMSYSMFKHILTLRQTYGYLG